VRLREILRAVRMWSPLGPLAAHRWPLVVGAVALLAAGVLTHYAVRARDADGWTLLHWAAYQGDVPAIRALLVLGADPYAECEAMGPYAGTDILSPPAVNAWNKRPLTTPLQVAVARSQVGAAQALVEGGVDVNRGSRGGVTPLHVAARRGQEDSCLLLLRHGAEVDARHDWGWTPLHSAVWAEEAGAAGILLQHGAHPDAATQKRIDLSGQVPLRVEAGLTPLHMTAGRGSTALGRLLLAHSADPNARAHDGSTPLHYAADRDHRQLIGLLVDGGAHIDSRDGEGRTPLFRAAQRGSVDALEALLACGADPDSRDVYGNCPLHIISVNLKGEQVARRLLESGADVNVRDGEGCTPLDRAWWKKGLAGVLYEHGGQMECSR